MRLIIQKEKKYCFKNRCHELFTLTFKHASLLLYDRLASGFKHFSFDNHVLPMLSVINCYSTTSGPCSELTQWAVLFLETTPKPGCLDIPYLYIEKAANNINICQQASWSVVNLESPSLLWSQRITFLSTARFRVCQWGALEYDWKVEDK